MAFGQTNTGFQVGIGNKPFSTGFSTGFSSPFATQITSNSGYTASKTTQKKDGYTYNSRYPGFDEEDYKRLEQMVAEKGITGSKKQEVMDQLYEIYYPQVLNKHKLDERQQEINNSIYQNGELLLSGDEGAVMGTKLTTLAQDAKKKFGIPYNVSDDEVINAMVSGIDNGSQLLYDYVHNNSQDIYYAAGIYEMQGGGYRGDVNQLGQTEKTWEDKNLREKGETVTNYTNFVGWGTEELDEAANDFADRWLMLGQKAAESTSKSLKEKIENMSPKEVEEYRKLYKQLLKDKDWRYGIVQGDTLVEQLWNMVKGNVSYDYDEEQFMKWLVSQKADLWESLSGADDILNGEHNANVIQFFGNIPGSALKTFTATVRGMTNPYDTIKGLYKLIATEEGHQAILARYGSWDAFSDALNNDPVGVADDILAVVELGTNIARGGMTAYGKATGNPNIVANASKIPVVGSANDALAQKTVGWGYGLMDNAAKYGDTQISKLTNGSYNGDLLQKLSNQGQVNSNAAKLYQEGKDVYNAAKDYVSESSIGKGVKNFADEIIDKTVGIDKEDRQFIRDNKDLVNDYVNKKKTVDTAFDDLKEMIDDKRLEKTEMGQEYGKLRKNKSKVVDTTGITNDMKKVLRDNGITIDKNGDLKFKKLNKFNPTQQKAILDAWEELKLVEKSKNINAGEVLDMRQKFDDKLNWDGKATDIDGKSTATNKATEDLIKEMRGVIDERAKTSVEGLKELDAKYSEAWDEIQQIKKDWLNPDGTIKDSARSKLRNLTKAGNEAKLERLEKLMPGISQELKALDVALTVDRATKMSVGQYIKGGAFGSAAVQQLFSGNILGALGITAVGVLATPKNFVWLISHYPEIGNKLISGVDLTPAEITKLQSIATRLQDGMDVEEEE